MEMEKPKERDTQKDKKMFVRVVWNCAAEIKLLLTLLLLLCSLATLLQFLPSRFSLSPSDLRICLSKLSTETPSPSLSHLNLSSHKPISLKQEHHLQEPKPQEKLEEEAILEGPIVKRSFNPFGSAAYLFVQMGCYRDGLNTFAVVGLASKPLHVYGKPRFECEWVPENSTDSITAVGYRILPDWGYGRVYTVVVVNCTFPVDVGADGSGGKLVLHASTGSKEDEKKEKIVVLKEPPKTLNLTTFTEPPQYDYFYCGSSLYGNLSPQRIREWLAYHVKLFGEKSHFVIHDAGGVHESVLEVFKPWIEKGFVTLQDVRDQERFDGYYHNQFLVVNDCLHRYRFMAKWMFFFDVDEYIYVPPKSTIGSLVDSLKGYSQFTIEQMPMSNKLCLTSDAGMTPRMWGFEKLVYRDVKRGVRRDRKYAIQPRNAFTAGVHMSQNVVGRTQHKTERKIKYFHYHGTIAERREPCQQLVNTTELTFEDTPYVLDGTLRATAKSVKSFELKAIGSRLQRTRQ